MHFASIIILMLLPGCWLAFCPGPTQLSFSARGALAIALSPTVAAIQFYGLRLAGLTFQQVVPVLQLINLGSIFFIVHAFRRNRPQILWGPLTRLGIVTALISGCAAIPWLWDPEFRRYSWHGLLNIDIIYAFPRGALLPEDPELAAVSLGYPWVGHIFWSLLAWSADLSPTVIYVLTNLALLTATGVLSYWVARELGASEPTSLAVPVIVALGTNVPGLIGWSIIPANDNGVWWAILGDLRYAPFLLKFVTFEAMTFGLTLYAGLVLLCVAALRYGNPLELLLAPVVVAALGTIYPNLFPAAALLLGGLIAMLIAGRRYIDWRCPIGRLVALLALAGLAAVAGVWFVDIYTAGRASGAMVVSSPGALAKKSIAAVLALGPFAIAMYWMWRSEPFQRRAPLMVLAFGAAGAAGLNIMFRISGLHEYKFIFAAGMCLAAPAMIGLERLVIKSFRCRWAITAALPVMLGLVMVSYSIMRIPRHGSTPMDARERSFWLALAASNPDAGWTNAVRTRTSDDTILVVNHPEFHTSSFTARSLLVPSAGDKYHFGYNQSSEWNLLELRGYPRQLFEQRYELLGRIYTAGPTADMNDILTSLRSLGRPVAIVFRPNDGRAFLRWLQANRIGSELFADGSGRLVYVIPASSGRQVAP